MKLATIKMKSIYTFLIMTLALSVKAQTVLDTVSLGTGYSNQVWYSLENGIQTTVAKTDWTIAFDASGFGSSVLFNSTTGATLYQYSGDTSNFSSLDTAGLASWTQPVNSDTNWSDGAFSRNQSGFDLGWGTYSTITHVVTGDRLYVIEFSNGNFQKLWIKSLAGGTYTFRHATLNNSMDMTHSLSKSMYSGKNFAYFNLESHQALDPEPASTEWDLFFTQYITHLPTPYLVSGILQNQSVKVAEVHSVADPDTYSDYQSASFDSVISTIGYDWKSYQGSWSIADSLIYFIETEEGAVWRLVMKGFGGSADGNFIFAKEQLVSTSAAEGAATFSLQLFPNPAGDRFQIIYHNPLNESVSYSLVDLAGRVVRSGTQRAQGLSQLQVEVSGLKSGMYLFELTVGSTTQIQKVILQ